jgi:hypothetical protein
VILVERRGAVGLITLNRPKALNALNSELIAEINSAAEAFDREVERRDASISAALSSLGELDAQQAQVFSSHLLGMERLAGLNEGRLADLHAEFVRETRAMEEEFMVDRGTLTARHAAFRAELLHALAARMHPAAVPGTAAYAARLAAARGARAAYKAEKAGARQAAAAVVAGAGLP